MSDKSILEQAQKICRNLLDLDLPETVEKIKDAISKVSQILPLEDIDREELLSRLMEVTGVTQDAPRILDNNTIEPWVLSKWSENTSGRRFWKRYRDYLSDEKKIAPKVISRLDELTDKILDRLGDPDQYDQFDRRGLVVGHVQSGKTSNYVGLVTKASDAGYKLIIVLAGIHSSLRSQTQLRIDEGFLGYDTVTSRSFSESTNRIGVGLIDPNVPAHSLTSSAMNGDFRKNVLEVNNLNLRGTDPVIVVIKKNNAVLKNLIQWLSAKVGEDIHGTKDRVINNLPLLLIDDEADNASINISKSSVSSINGSIRALLQLFRKSAYVGYTATPYANVFIPSADENEELTKGIKIMAGNKDYPVGDDLFPRDFIVNIPPPSNYIGPEKFFGIVSEDSIYENLLGTDDESGESVVPIHLYEPVNDYQPSDYSSSVVTESIREINMNFIPDGHKKDDTKPDDLPESLKRAVKFFILACAARRVRGQVNVHNSMLVHVTRFIDWQNHIALLVEEELSRYRNRIEFGNTGFLEELKHIWINNFEPKTKEVSALPDVGGAEMTPVGWDELELELLPAVTKIRVRAVHGSSLLGGLEPENIQALDYYENRKKGLSVIAVGGNKLSRGLTLEGLTISYYLRATKMYDTLMQMGRWFGYRPGYLDMCRLFTTNELVSHYKHITAATEEMRAEFDQMWLLRRRPIDYGLKVRAHTGVLTITATNKFRYKKMMSFSFSKELEETWQFDKSNSEFFEKNHNITRRFIKSLGNPQGPANTSKHLRSQPYVWYGENNYREVLNYIGEYSSSQPSFHIGLMKEYIEKQAANGKLVNWTIALINNSRATEENQVDFYTDKDIVGLSYRKDDAEASSRYYELAKAHIIGNFHEYIDLNDAQLEAAFEATERDRIGEGKDPNTEHPSPLRIRTSRPDTNGLLLIYPLNPKPDKDKSAYSDVPVIGLAISFPEIINEEKILYAVNDIFQKELYDYPDEYDTEELEPEDTDENKMPSVRQDTFSKETFISFIENHYQTTLDETEFFSGIVPHYAKTDDFSADEPFNNVVISSERADETLRSLPFYSEKEIRQFYLDDLSSHVILSPDEESVITGKYIAGLKRSKYITFSLHDKPAVFADSCWIIRSGRFNMQYLAALFNSTLFGAWVRIKGEQKKETYFIKNEVLYDFPVVLPEEDKLWLYNNIYELLVAAGKKEQYDGTGTMKSYYANILDALIFCTYFPLSMKNEAEKLYNSLALLIPKELPSGIKKNTLAEELFSVIYDRRHPVREVLYYLDNQSKVARIKSVFTR